ncbi:lysosomal proton-coupled steroid conjugate and bile acid symporter SLC46A3-like isoform X2 [Branchiostoma lanceolatum]|uniref:lysosomal proton-coupled steroid conjugate and bile acid symporter SLC46A3-like isoform X2 n=1 Tax=Branchiostoma lanceolatum TaxID=7740 RepID=UPI003456BC82
MVPPVTAWIRKYLTVEPVIFMYMTGSLLSDSVTQQLMYYKVCLQAFNDSKLCSNISAYHTKEQFIQKETAQWILYMDIADVVPSVLMLLLLGSWTDKTGRKSAMLLPFMGAVISGGNLIIQSVFIYSAVPYLFIGTIVSSLCGGYGCVLMATYSYVSDITDGSSRTWRIGILDTMSSLGAAVGGAVSGIILDKAGYLPVFILYVGLNATTIVYILLWMKESVQTNEGNIQKSKDRTLRSKTKGLLNIENVKSWGRVIVRSREGNGRLHVILLLLAFTVNIFLSGTEDLGFLFIKHQLGSSWTSTMFGLYLAVRGIALSIGLMVILPLMSRLMCDTKVGQAGALSKIAAHVLLAFVSTVWMLFLVPVLGILSGFIAVTIRSLCSKTVADGEKEVTCPLLASLLFNKLYTATLSSFPGFCFIISAGLLLVPIILLQWMEDTSEVIHQHDEHVKQKKQNSAEETQPLLTGKPGVSHSCL